MSARYMSPESAPARAEIDAMRGAVLVEFGTEWCGYCRALAPSVEALLVQHPEIRHLKVEDGPAQPLGRSFGVKLWPNLVFMRDGAIVRQLARPGREELEGAFRALAKGSDPA